MAGFQVQPSELARISIALLLAYILERDDQRILRTRTLLLVGAVVGVPMLFVLLQPDSGSPSRIPVRVTALFFGGMRTTWWIR